MCPPIWCSRQVKTNLYFKMFSHPRFIGRMLGHFLFLSRARLILGLSKKYAKFNNRYWMIEKDRYERCLLTVLCAKSLLSPFYHRYNIYSRPPISNTGYTVNKPLVVKVWKRGTRMSRDEWTAEVACGHQIKCDILISDQRSTPSVIQDKLASYSYGNPLLHL